MNAFELAAADLASVGMTPGGHPVALIREFLARWHELPRRGDAAVVPANALLTVPDGTRIRVAGVVTHRQRPATAGGVVFFGVEDETGLANVMVTRGLWKAQRTVAATAKMVVIRGIVHNASGAASVTADLIEAVEPELRAWGMRESLAGSSRDFR